ncbi:MAG: hypothetical protein ACRDHY_09805 [Anaerolineales bacterium]
MRKIVCAAGVWIAGLIACNLPGRPPAALPPADPTVVPAPPTSSPTPAPPPASDLAGALYQGVEAGRWTPAEAVILILRLLAGEIEGEAVLPNEGLIRGEATRVFSLAHQLLDGDDLAADERVEIERLLRLAVPSREDLDRFASTESRNSRRGGIVAAVSAQDDECETIWREDWVDDRLTTCFLRREAADYRLYYPASWAGEAGRIVYVDAAEDSVRTARATFSGMGLRAPPVYVVFSLLSAERLGGRRSWYASAASWMDPCPIMVYPPGLDPDLERYKQILAHEMFHCVQGASLSGQMAVGTPTYDWWVEGTAEYFANVAFPDADAENEYLEAFDLNSIALSLLDMDYENFLFFQHWANEAGNGAVVAFLRGLPTAPGTEAQRAALAAAPEIGERFHRLGELYLDRNIPDAGGDLVPVRPSVETVELPETTYDAIPASAAFVLRRYGLLYFEDRQSQNTLGEDGAPGRSSARTAGEGEWGRLPDAVRTACDPLGYYLVVTTANAEDEDHHLVLDVIIEEKRGCDECLLGRWVADNITFQEYLRDRLGDAADITLEAIEGEMWAEFREDGTGQWGYEDFSFGYLQTMSGLLGDDLEIHANLAFAGGGTNLYFADGSLLTYESGTYDVTIAASLAGEDISLGSGSSGLSGAEPGGEIFSGGVPYVCSEDEARFGPVGDVATDRIVWRRVGD